MGFTPAQVDEMSLWQFRSVLGGVAKANGQEDKGLFREDAERLSRLLDQYE